MCSRMFVSAFRWGKKYSVKLLLKGTWLPAVTLPGTKSPGHLGTQQLLSLAQP